MSVGSEPWFRISNNLRELRLYYLLGVASFQLLQVSGVYLRSCVVLLQKCSHSVNQCCVFLLHNGLHLLQLFGVKVGIDGLTAWNELEVIYPLIIPPDVGHHLVFEMFTFGDRFWKLAFT